MSTSNVQNRRATRKTRAVVTKKPSEEQIDSYLRSYYYDPKKPGSFGGLQRLYTTVLQDGKLNLTKAQVNNWLKQQDAHTLHRGVRHRFPRVRVVTGDRDQMWDLDLIDMSKSKYASVNDDVKYILVAVDVLSRYAWAEPLKTKSASEVASALNKIFSQGRIPATVRSDAGKELIGAPVQKLLKDKGIYHYVTQDVEKASLAESWIRYFKQRLFKYMTATQNPRYIDILPDLVSSYNHTRHTSTGLPPASVNESNQEEVWDRLYLTPAIYAAAFDQAEHKSTKRKKRAKRYRFAIGNMVRVSYLRDKFDRGFDHNWSGEVFKVVDREYRQSIPVYHLEDLKGERLTSIFYSPELQRVTYNPEGEYNIEKVLATRVKNGVKQSYVKYQNWPDKFNEWINTSKIRNLVPTQRGSNKKKVKKFVS